MASTGDNSILSSVIYAALAPISVAAGLVIPYTRGLTVSTVAVSVALIITGVVSFGWACFERTDTDRKKKRR